MLKAYHRYIYSFLALIFAASSFAQIDLSENYEMKRGCLYIKNRQLDFGIIHEEDGVQTLKFIGWNIAKDPLVITKLMVSCGCTEVIASKDTLLAGDSVVIYVNYNPKGKSGSFEEPIFAFNTGIPYQVYLGVKGEVIPKPQTIADQYTVDLGNLKMNSAYYDFGFMYQDDIDTFEIKMYNSGDRPIQLKGIIGRPAYILLNNNRSVILPKQEGTIQIIYDARQVNEYGDMIHYLTLVTDDPYVPEVPLNVNAHILERFPRQTRRRKRHNPVSDWNTQEYNYGKILQGDTMRTRFVLRNDGKRPLIIHKIQPSCGCTGVEADKMEISSGDSAVISVAFHTSGRVGEDTKFITVITNDPAHPVSKLYLKGEIVENPNAL